MSGYWAELTTPELDAMEKSRCVCVLPVAAIEQHGPHLPLSTDAIICDGIVRELLVQLSDADPVLVLPQLNIGHSPEHIGFSGTLSLDAEVILAQWESIARNVWQSGFRRLVLLNSHGGQNSLVDLAAVRLRVNPGFLVARVNYPRLGVPEGLFEAQEIALGIHGGEVETSMMLHLAPSLVRMQYAENFRLSTSAFPFDENSLVGLGKPVGFGWRSEDLNAQGVLGNAANADAHRGKRYLDYLGSQLKQVCTDVSAAEWSAKD